MKRNFTVYKLVGLFCGLLLFSFQQASAQAPANDSLCNAVALTVGATCSGTPNGDNTAATSELNEPFPACFNGGLVSVWYSFVAPPSGLVTISTDYAIGTNTDTEIALYSLSGPCTDLSNLTEIACDQDGGNTVNFNSIIPGAPVTPGTTYYIQVSGWGTPATEGSFCITVDEVVGPSNDDLCDAQFIAVGDSCNGTPNGDNSLASLQPNEPEPACFLAPTTSVWYKFVGPQSGFVSVTTDVDVSGTNQDTEFAIYALPGGDCNDLVDLAELACNQDVGTVVGFGFNGVTGPIAVIPGDTFYIQVSGYSSTQGTFCIEIDSLPAATLAPNDSLCNAIPVTLGAGCNMMSNGDNTGGFRQIGEPLGSCFGSFEAIEGRTVWYSFVAPAGGEVTISTDSINSGSYLGSNSDTEIAVYELPGGDCTDLSDLAEIACNQDAANSDLSTINGLSVTPGETYYVQVSSRSPSGPAGDFCLQVEEFFLPPNDSTCDATPIMTFDSVYTSYNVEADTQVGESLIAPPLTGFDSFFGWGENGIDNSVWFKFNAPPSGAVSVNLCQGSTEFDTQVALYEATDCSDFSTFTFLGGNDDLTGCPQLFASFLEVTCLVPGNEYYILVDGYLGETGVFGIELSEIPGDTTTVTGMVTDPTCPGDTTGEIALSIEGLAFPFQAVWSTGDTALALTGLSAGTYSVEVRDRCDSVTTDTFTLTDPLSQVVNAGADTSVCEGDTIMLGGDIASGGQPFSTDRAFGFGFDLATFNNNFLLRFNLGDPESASQVSATGSNEFYPAGDFAFGVFHILDADLNELVQVDTSTGARTVVGAANPTAGEGWTGMAFDPTLNVMFGLAVDGTTTATLYTIDLSTGAASPLFPLSGLSGALPIWLACDNNGNLYSMDIVNDELLSVDKSTGAVTVIGSIGFDAGFAQDADFDPETNQLYLAAYGSAFSTAQLRVANLQTGATMLVGEIPGPVEVTAFGIAEETVDPYTYVWEPAAALSDPNVANPTATVSMTTDFVVTVTDACGTAVSDTITVEAAAPPSVALTSTPNNGTNNGTATATPSGGTAPYSYLWDNGDTSMTITGLDTGLYIVTVTDANGCTVTDSVQVDSNVGIEDLAAAGLGSLKLYPNPTPGQVQIEAEMKQADVLNVRVLDLRGVSLLREVSNMGSNHRLGLDLSSLPAGIYLIEVATSKGKVYSRITLQ